MKLKNIILIVLVLVTALIIVKLIRKDTTHASQKERSSFSVSRGVEPDDQASANDESGSSHRGGDVRSPEQSSGSELTIGAERYALLFESEDLTEQQKHALIEDLNLNLSHYEYISFVELPPGEVDAPELDVYETQITHWLDDGSQKSFFSDTLRRNFGGAVRAGDTYRVIINQSLVNAYKEAYQFKANHSAAVNGLRDFLAVVQGDGFIEKFTQNPDAYLLLSPDHKPNEKPSEIAVFLNNMGIRQPSILDYELINNGEDTEIRVTTLIDLGEGAGESPIKGFPELIYRDEAWKIYFPLIP